MGSSTYLCRICMLAFFVWVLEAGRSGSLPPGTPRVSNVKDLGAVSGTKSDSSQALLSAWKEACQEEGVGRVFIPEGTFLVGPLVFKGPCKGSMVFQLKGVLTAPPLDKFDGSETWIEFQYINVLTVTGGGRFDGQGPLAWPHNQCPQNTNCKPLPTSLRFSFVTDATIRGISSIDSKFFHIIIFPSKNVKLQALKISAPRDSPNTDGIHIALSTGITISRSFIGTGDDCISIGPGSFNISISSIYCGPGHGISIGSHGRDPNEQDVVGLRIKNCTFISTDNGIRIKTWPSSPSHSSASNFTFEDIVMNNVSNPIVIDQQYCPHSSCDLQINCCLFKCNSTQRTTSSSDFIQRMPSPRSM